MSKTAHCALKYGTQLIVELSKALTKKFDEGFSVADLKRMRRFYQLNQKSSLASQLDWTDYVELLPENDEKLR